MSLRAKVRRYLLLTGALALLLMCTGCDQILADILAGDECGDHAVCERAAAKAGAAAGAVALTGAALQSRRDEEDGDEPGEPDDGDGDDGNDEDGVPAWSLSKRPTDKHVWDAKEGKWVLPKDHDQAMKDKGYEFDETKGDGGAWRKTDEAVKPVEIPKEKGNVALPEYKPGIISTQAEASYERLEERFDQLNEMEQKAFDEYKRLRNELKEAEEAGDSWLAGKLRESLETAKANVDAVQAEKANLAARHEYHSDDQFKKRYDKGWTAGAVAKELLLDPFTHMIAPDMSDTVDVMANAIAARNRLEAQGIRQDKKLFNEHDQAMKDLRDVIQKRHDALERGDAEEAARLKDQGDAIKGRMQNVANRMNSIHDDVKDWQQKSLKATVEAGTTATDRVVSGRGAYETGKMVGKAAGYQTEAPEVKVKRPTVEEAEAKTEAKAGSKGTSDAGGKGKSARESSAEAKAQARESSGAGGRAESARASGSEASGASRAEGSSKSGAAKEASSSDGGGAPSRKSLQDMVKENPNAAQEAGRRATVKAEWEQQYQEHAAQARAEGRAVREDIRGRSLPSTEKEWIARDRQLGLPKGTSTVGQGELLGIEPSPQVQAMRAADPKFADLDQKIRECWRKSGPGVGPGFEPDYYDRFVKNMRDAKISEEYYRNWLNAVRTGKYVETATPKPMRR